MLAALVVVVALVSATASEEAARGHSKLPAYSRWWYWFCPFAWVLCCVLSFDDVQCRRCGSNHADNRFGNRFVASESLSFCGKRFRRYVSTTCVHVHVTCRHQLVRMVGHVEKRLGLLSFVFGLVMRRWQRRPNAWDSHQFVLDVYARTCLQIVRKCECWLLDVYCSADNRFAW